MAAKPCGTKVAVKTELEAAGFTILKEKQTSLTEERAREFYRTATSATNLSHFFVGGESGNKFWADDTSKHPELVSMARLSFQSTFIGWKRGISKMGKSGRST